MKTVVLDAGALIALERRDGRMLALLREIISARISAHVPAAVVAQVWRGSARQHAVIQLLKAEVVRVHALTDAVATRIGLRLGSSGTSDVIDAHVALLGRSLRAVVLTSDPDDLKRVEPDLEVVAV
jgi:predicted nucleic acid-binding protein